MLDTTAAALGLKQPVPFEVQRHDTPAGPVTVASNGTVHLQLRDSAGRILRRRAVKGLALKPAAEMVLPALNALAGDLLQDPQRPAQEVVAALLAIAGTVPRQEPQRVEWAVAELAGVYVYTDGVHVIVTRQGDLLP